FDSVVLDGPVVHLIVYPDGSTNQPEPLVRRATNTAVEDLFALSIRTLEVRRGQVIFNDQKYPLDFTARDVSANLAYSLFHRQYDGELLLGKLDTTMDGYRPFAWTAEVHFTVARNHMVLKSVKATSGRSHVDANGTLESFRDPKLNGHYDATLDLAELAAITRRHDLERGTVQLSGDGTWTVGNFESRGKLLLKGLRAYTEVATLSNAEASARFAATRDHLSLSQLDAHLLGGTARGDADIVNWLSTSEKPARAGKQRGTVHLKIDSLPVREIAAALTTRRRPLNRSNVAGDANGTIDVRWTDTPRKAVAAIALDVIPPAQPAPGQVPVNARIRATYDLTTDAVDVADFAAVTRATQVRASGTMSSKAAIKLSVVSTDLEEWRPLLSAFGESDRLPVTVHGRASFNGTATGKLSSLTIAGNLQAQDFDSLVPATASTPERELHWDSLSADLQLSSRSLAMRNAVLRHGPALIDFDLTATLQQGVLTPSSPFTAHVNIRNGNLAEVAQLAGYNYPVTGTVNLSLQAGGTRAAPNGEGHVQLTNAVIYGQPVQRFVSDLRFSGGEAQLNNIQLSQDGARVTGGSTLNLASGEFRFNLTGTNFDLQHIPQLHATRVAVDGRMDFVAQGSGTLAAPTIDAKLHLRDLAFDRERAGDFDLDLVTRGGDMQVTGRSQFKEADLIIDGTIHVRGDWPSNINLHFNHLDVDSLLRVYLRGRLSGHSAVAGDLQLRGPLRKPHELNVAGNLSDVFADIQNIKIRNDGPVRFAL